MNATGGTKTAREACEGARRSRTAHEADREPRALDEASAERVEAAGRLVSARRRQNPPEPRGRRLPWADAPGAFFRGEVRGAACHRCAAVGSGRGGLELERGEGKKCVVGVGRRPSQPL